MTKSCLWNSPSVNTNVSTGLFLFIQFNKSNTSVPPLPTNLTFLSSLLFFISLILLISVSKVIKEIFVGLYLFSK